MTHFARLARLTSFLSISAGSWCIATGTEPARAQAEYVRCSDTLPGCFARYDCTAAGGELCTNGSAAHYKKGVPIPYRHCVTTPHIASCGIVENIPCFQEERYWSWLTFDCWTLCGTAINYTLDGCTS